MKVIYDPILKLEMLKLYISKRVDYEFNNFMPFEQWLLWKHPEKVPYSTEYCKSISTHCYYCREKIGIATVDHFMPRSKRKEDEKYKSIFVICCKKCNVAKSNIHPDNFLKRLNKFSLIGVNNDKMLLRFGKNIIPVVNKQVNNIFNDTLYGISKTCYYISVNKKLPKGFLKVA